MPSASLINKALRKREEANNPIRVAVFGTGWYGRGLIQELLRCPGIIPKVVINRKAGKAAQILQNAGVGSKEIVTVEDSAAFKKALRGKQYIATGNVNLIGEMRDIDALFDATGNIPAGALAAERVLKNKIHFVTVSAELDSTVGCILNKIAEENSVIYTNSDGDQPGVLMRMIESVTLMGFEIVVAGSCKGFIDVHKTPDDIMPYVRPGHNPRMIASFTDGTKQGTELCVLANATGLKPDIRGMHGPTTTKETLVEDFLKIISRHGIVDYVLGINGVNQGAGVFVVGKREGETVYTDMEYLKKGRGPYYLFFKDEHLCYFESISTIAEAVLFNSALMKPQGIVADLGAFAKRDLKAGEYLDGMGGYTVYGLIDTAENIRSENILPVGVADGIVLSRDVKKDSPITYDMVELPADDHLINLKHQQNELISHPAQQKATLS